MGGYRKQCPECRRIFTHPPAYTIHRKSCGVEGRPPSTPRSPRSSSPKSRGSSSSTKSWRAALQPEVVDFKPATARQRAMAYQMELSLSTELDQAAMQRDIEALSPRPRPAGAAAAPPALSLEADEDEDMARQLQRELNGFRGRSPRRQSYNPVVEQARPQWDNAAAGTTLVGRKVCRTTKDAARRGQPVGTVTGRVLRGADVIYKVIYDDGNVAELGFDELRGLLEPLAKPSRFMSLAGGAGLAMEPEEPKVIRIGTDFQCTSIPTMPPNPGAAAAERTSGAEELTAAGTTLWSPTAVEPARLSVYLDAAAQQLRPAEPGEGAEGRQAEGISRGEMVECALEHLGSHEYNLDEATAKLVRTKPLTRFAKTLRQPKPVPKLVPWLTHRCWVRVAGAGRGERRSARLAERSDGQGLRGRDRGARQRFPQAGIPHERRRPTRRGRAAGAQP